MQMGIVDGQFQAEPHEHMQLGIKYTSFPITKATDDVIKT
jgi:hypothetical protein